MTPVDDLDELLAAVDDRPDLAAGVTALLAEAAFAAFDFDVGLAAAREATRLARLSGDDEVLAFVLFAQGLQHQGRFELDASERCFAESIAAGGTTTRARLWSRDRLPSVHWLRGDLSAAESAASASEAAAAEALDWAELSLVTAWRAAGAGACGRLGDAIGLGERALALQRRSDYAFTSIVARPVLVLARALRGDVDGARRTIEEWTTGSSSRWQQQLGVLALALSGDVDGAGAELDRRPWRLIADGAVDLRTAASLCAQVEVGDLLDRPEMAAAGLPALTSLHRRGVRFVPGSLALVSRLAGVAAARGGDREGAAGWFATARHDAARAGAAGERARTDLDEVRLLGGGGAGSPAAAEALAGAATAFDHLGMLPFLRRCEATAAELGLPSAERLGKVVLFTDLVGSTALNAAAGDRRYVRLLRTHDRVLRDLLQRHDGVEFKHTGDGLAAWFSSARRAVRCALDLHGSVALAVDADFGLDVRLRCGLAAGDPIEDAGDLFGLSVTRAARLCQQAAPGEVLVSAEVLPMVGDAPVAFADRGLVPLRGIPEPTHVFAAARPDA